MAAFLLNPDAAPQELAAPLAREPGRAAVEAQVLAAESYQAAALATAVAGTDAGTAAFAPSMDRVAVSDHAAAVPPAIVAAVSLSTELVFEEPPALLRIADPCHFRAGSAERNRHAHASVFAGHVLVQLSAEQDCVVGGREHCTNVSLARLHALIHVITQGDCFCEGYEDFELLSSIHRLAQSLHGSQGKPRQLVYTRWQPPLPWLVPSGHAPIAVRLDIWLSDLIFEIRSDYDICEPSGLNPRHEFA